MSEVLSGTPNFQQLEKKLGCSWLAIRKLNSETQKRKDSRASHKDLSHLTKTYGLF